jgi:hypothetical protein
MEKEVDISVDISIAKINTNIEYIKRDIGDIKTEIKVLKENFVTQKDFDALKMDAVTQREFSPVRTIAYGLIGTISLSVLGALLLLVVN